MSDDRPIFMRTVFGLVPSSDSAREVLAGIPVGSTLSVDVSRPRNIRFHRLYWALCGTIADSIGANRESVSDVLKLRSGHFAVIQTANERYRVPRSISFAKMAEGEFKTFFEKCCQVIVEEFLPHMKSGELMSDIEKMVGLNVESKENA